MILYEFLNPLKMTQTVIFLNPGSKLTQTVFSLSKIPVQKIFQALNAFIEGLFTKVFSELFC